MIKQVNIVWIKIINPIESGWFKKNIVNDINIINREIKIFVISNSKNSLIKIIILEIIDKEILFLWSL